jgi:hypothetical protein
MQIKFKIALAVAGFALATVPAFAVEMPTNGSKNFSAPGDAPSYFANEAVPEAARVDHPANFTREDVAASPDVGQVAEVATEPEPQGKYPSARKSSRHATGKSKGHSGSTRYAKSTSSKATRTATVHGTAKSSNTGSRTASAATGKSAAPAGASKTSPTRHAKSGTRQHVEAIPRGVSPLVRI